MAEATLLLHPRPRTPALCLSHTAASRQDQGRPVACRGAVLAGRPSSRTGLPSPAFSLALGSAPIRTLLPLPTILHPQQSRCSGRPVATCGLKALVFDCDGVILESEDLHRQAYNATFQQFGVQCPGEAAGTVSWSPEFYDVLQNRIGGGKPKMRWYFGEKGWPHSSLFIQPPTTDEDKEKLIDALQDWKTQKYQDLIGSGSVSPRPGVLELMDEAKAKGLFVAVCSAATKSSVVFTLKNLLGKERFESLDCFLAGDDVPKKKPDPTIYKLAAQKLEVDPEDCIVVEDSVIGLQAAAGAGMPCVITYTSSTKEQDFAGAVQVLPSLEGINIGHLEKLNALPQPAAP